MNHDDGMASRRENEFQRIWQNVSAIGNRMTAVEGTVERLDMDINNHGREGLKTQFISFVAETRGARAEQERMHEANSTKLNLIMALAAVLTLVVTIIFGVLGYEAMKHATLDPYQIFHSQHDDPVLSLFHQQPQDAGSMLAVHY